MISRPQEDEEQDIFEFSVSYFVEELAQALPLSVIYHVHSEESMSRAHAKEFETRLRQWLYGKCGDLPFLTESDQRKIVQCLLVLLLRSMRKPKSDVGALTNVEMHKLVFEVFVKGAVEVFYDDAQRKALVSKVENYACAIPFIPTFLFTSLCDMVLERAADGVTPILVDTYYQFLLECEQNPAFLKTLEEPPEEDASLVSTGEDTLADDDGTVFKMTTQTSRPFTAMLRRNLCNGFIDHHVFWLVPRKDAERYALLFVDSFLEAIESQKLDQIMTVVGRDPRIRRALIVDNCHHHDHEPHTTDCIRASLGGAREL